MDMEKIYRSEERRVGKGVDLGGTNYNSQTEVTSWTWRKST